MKPHEIKSAIDNAVSLLETASDTDDVYWSVLMVGQDSEQAEDSGYLQGYRAGLEAAQQLVGHHNPEPLRDYLTVVRDTMTEQQEEVDDRDPEGLHFWHPDHG